jgi:hypothetical protein
VFEIDSVSRLRFKPSIKFNATRVLKEKVKKVIFVPQNLTETGEDELDGEEATHEPNSQS